MAEVNSFETLATYLDERFGSIDQSFAAINEQFIAIDHRFDTMDQRFDAMDQRLNKIEGIVSDMPTKLYVNQKVAVTEAAIAKMIKILQTRHERLVDILKTDQAITEAHHKEVAGLPNM